MNLQLATWVNNIKAFIFQSPIGTGTLLLGIAAIVTVFFKVVLPNTIQVEVQLTNEEINQLVQTQKTEEFLQVEESIQKVEGNSKAPVIDRAVVEAYRLKEVGRIDDSIEKWRSIANLTEGINDNLAAQSWFAIAALFLEKGMVEQALLAYDKSIGLKPDNAATYHNRGALKADLGDYVSALEDYNEAIRLKPDYPETYYNRGNVKGKLGDHVSALEDYNKAIRLKPDFPKAYVNRGLTKVGLGRHASALEDYNEAIRLKPDYPEVYVGRGVMRAVLGDRVSALEDFDQASRLKPDYPDAYVDRGVTKLWLNNIKGAKADFQIAMELAEQQGTDDLKVQMEQQIQELDNIK